MSVQVSVTDLELPAPPRAQQPQPAIPAEDELPI